jgi:argininosuccinate synthase
MTERVVLAYSGGLDTSVAIPYIVRETGAEFRIPALQANALDIDLHPPVSALPRPLIVEHLVAAAARHDGTGKDNDQLRFEAGAAALSPEPKLIAPARDHARTRDTTITYAEKKGLPLDVSARSPYSIDRNIWGPTVGTGFPDRSAPLEDLYECTSDPAQPREADEAVVTEGISTALDARPHNAYQIIARLDRRAGAQRVGRLDPLEDRSTPSSPRRQDMSPPTSGSACTVARRRHRPAQRRVVVRLRSRDIRHRRPVRPEPGQGLRRALGAADRDRGAAGSPGRLSRRS